MTFFEALVAIIAICAFVIMRSQKYRHSARMDGDRAPLVDNHREAELTSEVTELRQRIAVLERIATDANTTDARNTRAIADEIESLRDR